MNASARIVACSAVLVFLTLRCVELPPSPVLPTTDIQGSIPLVDRMFLVSDFSSKDSALTTTPDGGLLYEASETFDPLVIGTIEIQPEAASQQSTLGTFEVQTPSIAPISFTYEDVSGVVPPPGPFIILADTFSTPSTGIGPLASFEYIEFDSGTISITVENTLPVALEFEEPLIIRNALTGSFTDTSLVALFTFVGPIGANGGTQTRSASLAGVTLRHLLRISPAAVSTPGSGGPVSVTSGMGLSIQVSFTGTRVRAAKATIPSQSVLNFDDSTFVVDDSVTLVSAVFRGGSFSVELENNIDVDVNVYVRFTELQDRLTGVPFEVSHQFTGAGTFVVPIAMSGLKYQSSGNGIGTVATFTVGASTVANSDSSREVRSTDFVRVVIIPGPPILVERVTGRIKPTTIDINTGASGFSLGEIARKVEGEFSFDSLSIALTVATSSGFPTDYDLRFIGMDRRSNPPKMDSLNVPPPFGSVQRRLFPATSLLTPIILDQTAGLNAFLEKFFPHLPDTFIVRGTMTVNPHDVFGTPEGLQTVYDTSKIYSSVDMSFPVRMGITTATLRDSVPLNIREKFPKEFASSTKSGTLYFEIENGLPLAIEFRSALLGSGPGGDRDTLLLIPVDGPRAIGAGATDGSGSVTASTVTRFSMTFSGPEAQRFEEGEVLLIQLDLQTPSGGSIVKVRSTDFVKVRASGNLVYQVNKPR